MPTGDKRVNIYNKRNVPQEGWDLHFFRFLDDKINDTTRAAFLQSGVLGDDYIGLTGDTDRFNLDLTLEHRVMDGFGHIIDLDAYKATFGITNVGASFENELGVEYYIGIRYQEIPNDVERNPRSSEPEYPWFQDIIGERGAPDTVTDFGTYIRLEVNGITEAGVDHSNNPAVVWLNNPVSPDDSVAYFTADIQYSGGVNYVDIPYSPSQGPLGQTAPEFTISTNPLDYQVCIPIVSWFRNTDISTDQNYAFIGKVTGAGAGNTPTVFDTSGQRPVFLISLDRAYRANSPDDPAPGRTIFADKKAVRIKQSASNTGDEDWINEAFRIDQFDQGGSFLSRGATVLSGYHNAAGVSVGWSHYLHLTDGPGGDLEPIEAFVGLVGLPTIQLTRVGVDLVTKFDPWMAGGGALVKLSGTTGGSYDGFYYISGNATTNTVDIMDAGFTPVSFPAGIAGTVQFTFPLQFTISGDWVGPTAFSELSGHYLAWPAYGTGQLNAAYGELFSPGQSYWYRAQNRDLTGNRNAFYDLYACRAYMWGGGTVGSFPLVGEDDTFGHAHYNADKLRTDGLGPDWQPTESKCEMGFDYRGAHFGKWTTDYPAYQLGQTFRHPLYDSAGDFFFEEHFVYQTAGDTLLFDRVGFDNTNMPFQVSSNPNMILCELQFNDPYQVYSGIYFAAQKPATNQIRFERIDGSNPGFAPTTEGVCRFFGGVFLGGPITDSLPGSSDMFLLNFCSPTKRTGGLRYAHRTDDTIGSTDWNFALWFTNIDEPMFALRDGGITYARALSTKSAFGGHGLTQWDQICTSYYTGDLAEIDIIRVYELGGRFVQLEGAYAGDWINLQTGAVTGAVRAQSIVAGNASFTHNSALACWKVNTSDNRGVQCTVTTGQREYWQFPLDLPNNSILESVSIRGNPGIGDGTSNAMGFGVYRHDHAPGSTATLLGPAFVRWSAGNGVTQTVTFNPTGLNTILNSSYDYFVVLTSSAPTGATVTDRAYYCNTGFGFTNWGSALIYGR